jgi:putative FmdB family regulatory protein
MPTYEYACEKCGQNFEAFQSMRDEPFRECPKELCREKKWGHGKVKRLLGTGAGIIFKGSGFYSTDYRSPSYQEAAKKETPAATSGSDAKTEKKEGTPEKKEATGATPAPAPAKTKPKKEGVA